MNAVLKACLVLFTLIIHSCATSPTQSYKDIFQSNSESQELVSQYLEAISLADAGKNQESCSQFKELERNENFPQQSLVFLQMLENCEYLPNQLVKFWKSDQYLPKWIKEDYISLSLDLAKQHSMDLYIAKFSFMKAKYQVFQKDKIKYLNLAIKIAKKYEFNEELPIYQKLLYAIAPRFNPSLTKNNIYSVASDLEKNREFSKARKLYRKITRYKRYGIDLIYKSYNRIRLSYKNERDMKNYLLKTKKMYNQFQKGRFYSKYKIKTAITYARAVWTDHKRPLATKILKKSLKVTNLNNENKALIHWLLGSMKLERAMETPNREEHFQSQAIWYYKKANSFKTANLTMRNKIRWSISFTYFLKKNYKNAFRLFSQFKDETKSDAFRSKFSYWEAKSLHSLKEYDDSLKLFKKLSKKDPFSYYGIMATKESRHNFKPLKGKNEVGSLDLPIFEWLVALKEEDLSVKYLNYQRKLLRGNKKIVGLLPLYFRSKAFDKMIHLYFSLSDSNKEKVIKSNPEFVYPRPFMDNIIDAENKSGVDRNLILSISRQESAFNPYARSHADAFGVMQLLPERGRSVANENEIVFNDYYDLFKPKKNIMLGAILLGKLQESFAHKFPLYVASYNASGLAVRRWYKDRYKGDFVKFIEMIPYAETQKYVKLVLRNYFIYKRLNANESFAWNPTLFNKADI